MNILLLHSGADSFALFIILMVPVGLFCLVASLIYAFKSDEDEEQC